MSAPSRRGFHAGTRGTIGKDALQREQHTARDRMVHRAADRLTEIVEADSWILVGGIPEVANALIAALPDAVRPRARAVDLDVHASEAGIRLTTERELTEASRARTAAVIDDLAARRAEDGRGVLQLPQTLQMLREKSVERLIFTDGLVREHPDDAEAAIRLALEQGADIELVSGEGADRLDTEAHGIAAALRFVPYSSPASRGTT
jgi:stalled ribosome rescue protein Dom34